MKTTLGVIGWSRSRDCVKIDDLGDFIDSSGRSIKRGPLVEFGGRQIPLTITDKKTNLDGGAGEEHAYAPVMGKSGTAAGVGSVCRG
jgi:hypothetical protein